MNIASIFDSLKDTKRILKEADLYKQSNLSRKMNLSINKFSEEFIKSSQGIDYEKTYRIAMQNLDFDYLLTDDSFFQFSCTVNDDNLNQGTIRYAFYENPRSYKTYNEFLEESGFSYSECGDELFMEYEQEIDEAKIKNAVTPIRYDYDFELYDPSYHPISHLHIGHNNNVRIPLNKILTPSKFTVFVLQNTYIKQWRNSISQERFREMCKVTKSRCYDIESSLFTQEEMEFLYLS